MQNTENFNLKVYDGEDLFNPLTVENVNMNAIDTQMKKNENHAVGDATELVSGTVHAITRLTPDAPMLRFTATSRFTTGDTFTVDGVQVSALTVSGEQLPDGAYIIGSEVLAYLKGTLLTVFTSQGTLATAKNALKLGGNDPEYYATASAVQTAQETATAAGNLANEVNNSLSSEDYSSKITVSDEVTLQYAIKTGKKVEIQVYIPVGTTFPTGFKNVVNISDLDATKPKYTVFSPNGYKDLNTPLGARIIETGVQIFGNNTTNQGSIVVYASCYVH